MKLLEMLCMLLETKLKKQEKLPVKKSGNLVFLNQEKISEYLVNGLSIIIWKTSDSIIFKLMEPSESTINIPKLSWEPEISGLEEEHLLLDKKMNYPDIQEN